MRIFFLYTLTAIAEIVGCYSVHAWLRLGRSAWWLAPGALALGVFAWLLTFHPAVSGRVYAAYGGVYIAVAILWLWLIDGVRPTRWDLLGSATCITGALVIYFAPQGKFSTGSGDNPRQELDEGAAAWGRIDAVASASLA